MADEAGSTVANVSGAGGTAAAAPPQMDRRAALDARFKASAEERQASKEARLAAAEDATDPAESGARFWAQFNEQADALHAEKCASVEAGRAMGDAEKRAVMPPRVESWLATLAALQKASAQASLFLPKYDVRQAEARLATLRDEVDEARAQLVPRKKFAFRRRQKNQQSASDADDTVRADSGGASGDAEAKTAVDSCAKFDVAMKSFEGQRGATLIVRPGELCGGDASASVDFRLTDLEDCTVLLLDVTRALHIDKLTRCHVVTGPVAGSVLMEACNDCTFVFASRQIRLHTSHRCDFYLHVLSRPIIEHCDTLRFACYTAGYDALPAQLTAAELDKPRAATMWRCVDDFGWHRTQHSPNWSLLPQDQYRVTWPDAVGADIIAELGARLEVPAAAAGVDDGATVTSQADGAHAAGDGASGSAASAAVAATAAEDSDSDGEL